MQQLIIIHVRRVFLASGARGVADLGGGSKYSKENFEGRSGEGFHVKSVGPKGWANVAGA